MLRLYLLILMFLPVPFVVVADPLQVWVSIPPQKYLVERIAGNRVSVTVLLQPGHSPETYDPSPRQIAGLAEARIYFLIGVPFEHHWIDVIRTRNRALQVVECCDANTGDPHIWTDPDQVRTIAGLVRDTLTEVDPDNTATYASGYRELLLDLEDMDREIQSMLAQRKTDYFIVTHDSWRYFARRYGLVQVAVESLGRQKGPRGLIELVELGRREGIKTVFIQKQHPNGAAETLARELDANIVSIDPLAEDYITNLLSVTRSIAEAIQ